MASLKGFLDWVKGEDMEDDYDEEYISPRPQPAPAPAPAPVSPAPENPLSMDAQRANNKVVNIHATTQLAVVLVKPDRFENAAEIADHLKDKRTVVLNLEQTNKDIARRLVDFLSGVAYANEGKIKRVANSTYIITPYNVDILGDLIDELESNGLYL
jgi:cell division inhibitor SepF